MPQFNLPNNNIQFGSQNNNLINNNIFYESQIMELKKQLNEERNKNQILLNENTQLKYTINNLNMNITNYTNQITFLQNELLKYQTNFNNLNNFNNFNNFSNPFNNTINILKPGEKIMSINFISVGIQDISNYSIACKNTDIFIRLEEKLNNDFPQLKEHETYFESQGRRLKRFKTLEENNIKNNDVINIFLMDA